MPVTRPIRAVTFDFWNTLMYEGPQGLVGPRLAAWAGILEEAGLPVEQARLDAAHVRAFAGYQEAWHANRQYRVAEATACMLAELALDVPERVKQELLNAFGPAGESTELRLCGGVNDALRRMRDADVAVGIVCDIGLTPSTALRRQLADRGLLALFGSWAFSDEVGVYKPDPEIFLHALRPLGVEPDEAAHVGDRYRTDVAGAQELGMMAIRYAGVYDDPEGHGIAGHNVIDHYDALPGLLGVSGAP